jgi:hypothetical protein
MRAPGFFSRYATVNAVCATWSEMVQGRSRATEPLTASQWLTTRMFSPFASSANCCAPNKEMKHQQVLPAACKEIRNIDIAHEPN